MTHLCRVTDRLRSTATPVLAGRGPRRAASGGLYPLLLALVLVAWGPSAVPTAFAAEPPSSIPGGQAGTLGTTGTKAEEEEQGRIATVLEIKTEGGSNAEEAIKAYNNWLAKGGQAVPLDREFTELPPAQQAKVKELMVELYGKAGTGKDAFATVALLIKDGLPDPSDEFKKKYPKTQIDDKINVLMAKAREAWIEKAILKIGEAKGWKIARSDSGNVTAGIKSDIDQTFYVWERVADEKSVDGYKWARNVDLDEKFITEFGKEWRSTHEIMKDGKRVLTLDMLDVASHEGKTRFPDPRIVDIDNYAKAYRDTVEKLRNTKGAYTTYGAVLQQMQLRALQAIKEGNKRAFQQYGPKGNETSGEWKKWSDFDSDEAIKTMFHEGMKPELMHGLAFGAAMGNLVELQHYLHEKEFPTKYHLRPWEDAMHTEHLVKKGGDRKVEYTKLDWREKAKLNVEFLEKLFPIPPGTDAKTSAEISAKRTQHMLALEASAALRDLHGNNYKAFKKRTGIDVDASTPASKKDEAVFGALAKAIRPEDFNPDAKEGDAKARHEQLIQDASDGHRKLANEFVLRTAHYTSKDAFKLLIDADGAINLSKASHLLSDNVRKKMANVRDGTNISLLYGFYDLGTVEGWRMMETLAKDFPEHKFNLFKLYLQGQVQGFEGVVRARDVYFNIYGKKAGNVMNALNERVQRHVLKEFGLKNVEKARMAGMFLELEDLTWNWRKFAKEKAFDKSNLDAVGNVMRKYFETKGDMTEVVKQVADEMLLASPVIGQLETARRGGLQGWVILGATVMLPQAAVVYGQIKLVYALGEHMYAIHDTLEVAPVQDNIVDALYRGFAGPEARVFGEGGKPPPSWSPDDDKELASAYDRLRQAELGPTEMKADHGPGFTGSGRTDDYAGEMFRRSTNYSKDAPPILKQIEELEARRLAFKQMQDGPWMGNVFGKHAQLQQKVFQNYLLKDVPPLIGFFSKNVIDLRVPYDPKEEGRLAELQGKTQNHPQLLTRLQSSQELADLKTRKERRKLADDYVGRAKELEQNGAPEFMYRFKRDSLYPAFRQKHPNLTEQMITEHFLNTQTELWIDKWIADHRTVIVEELVKQGLLPESVLEVSLAPAGPMLGPTQNVPSGMTQATQRALPIDLIRFKDRVKADMARSRQLYLAYQEQEKNREQVARKNLVKAQADYSMASVSLWLKELGAEKALDPEMEALRDGMQEATAVMNYVAIPRTPPKLKATIFKITGKEAPGSDPAAKQKAKIGLDVSSKLTVDHTLYYPDKDGYKIDHHVLDKGLGAQGFMILPAAKPSLDKLLAQHKEKLDQDKGVIVAVSAYAAGMPDLSQAPKETLTQLTHVTTPQGILIAQQYGFVEIPPGPQPMDVWYEIKKFPVSGIHDYGDPSSFPPILKAKHHLDGTITGVVDHVIQLPGGVVETLKLNVTGKIDEATGRIDLTFNGGHTSDWSGIGKLGTLGLGTRYTGTLSGWRGSGQWGNGRFWSKRDPNVRPGQVNWTRAYFSGVTPENLGVSKKEFEGFKMADTKVVEEWEMRLVGNATSWPTADYGKLPKPMKKTWNSEFGPFVMDQFGYFVEGTFELPDKSKGVVRGSVNDSYDMTKTPPAPMKMLNLDYFNRWDNGTICMTSEDGGKSWKGSFYKHSRSCRDKATGALSLK